MNSQDLDNITNIYYEMLGVGSPAKVIKKIIYHATPSLESAKNFLNDKIEARVPGRFPNTAPAVFFTQGISQSLIIMDRIYGEVDNIYIANVDSKQLNRKKFYYDAAAVRVNGIMYLGDVPSSAVIKVDVYKRVGFKYKFSHTL
jgi:hypothetical protein